MQGERATPTVPGGSLPPGVEERFVEAGGLRFRVLAGNAGASGPPVLLLHGWPTWAEVWLPVATAAFGDRPWFAPDLPCHHRTGRFARGQVSVTSYKAAVTALFDALALRGASVIGCSLGGTLAVHLAIERADRVASVVLVDAAGLTRKLPSKTVRLYLPFFLRASVGAPGPRSVRKLLAKTVFVDPALATDAWVETLVAQWKDKEARRAILATGGALRKPDATVVDLLPQVKCPTLFLWGKQDPQFDWSIGQAACEQIPGARFVPIDRAGHFPMVERPQETAEAVVAFHAGLA